MSASAAGGSTGAASSSSGASSPGGSGGAAAGETAASGADAPAATGGNGAVPAASVLTDTQTLIPHASWDCGMPEGIPGPAGLELVFEADLEVSDVHDIGETHLGHRVQIDIKGGQLTGPKLKATFMDRGLDYQLSLANGAVEDEQVNILQTSDGAYIYYKNCGTAPGPGVPVRMVADFEAPSSGQYDWLNTGKFIGTREFDPATKKLSLKMYQAPAMVSQTDAVKVEEPDGVPDQSWECKKPEGTRGAVIYQESVGIGSGSIAVGASKRGTRNIIPITGGTTTGKIMGGVLSGGADYQLIGSEFVLDARYTLKTSDGELIIVRNCGPVGALVPVFEAATSGKYAWLNGKNQLSSDPGVGAGVVNLTIYEAN